ncbi:glycosyltransferase [Sulfolobus acidocaldarius]|uniref:Conserved protein n=4 Tax=Sulfolobus acidocaldarius TaxID=2285 RepID=Q4JAE4_SULAC|nr:glycosyltransferase [Sulfolobus acidocaldarius]AAY80235.1 conserved protein [Sulfolobus acidocaldarius DSM 639]AGE70815.1 hypothetical protein SacN8_04220 [Sulfolobus acidocaldarius N8]AGE73086.1 hypothetical protein SacRon12I_04210 [Sulfolobus acidocaldarius Ron12/I]ALU28868.1 glycosyl transferase family 1 [Sulfolobus acidocaldarius]ALU31590.1 glycosyl transferase family 1 [Sulfolobus acidocaldarius]
MRLKIAVIAHGIGMSKGYSGEGRVYKSFFKMLEEKGVDYFSVSFAKPLVQVRNPVYLVPFSIPRFDKYQRLLTYFSAKKVKVSLDAFLNASGVPIPLSNFAKHIIYAGAPAISDLPSKYSSGLWKIYLLPFKGILSSLKDEAKKARFVANSWYSAQALSKVYQIEVRDVVYPPVDVETFSSAYHEGEREKFFLTVGRIERGKMLENAVLVSALSKVKGVIVGSLREKGYYNKLLKLSRKMGADIHILTDLTPQELVKLMSRASVYFHPTLGEHFGIPVVEAMSAGLVPVVPEESGAKEVAPEFKYKNVEEASKLIKEAMEVDRRFRKELHERATEFSEDKFRSKMWEFIEKELTS